MKKRTPTLDECISMTRAPRLSTLADVIRNEFPGLRVVVETWTHSNDRKAGRLRIPGVKREVTVLTVYSPESIRHIYRHNSGETYRCNADVVQWMRRRKSGLHY